MEWIVITDNDKGVWRSCYGPLRSYDAAVEWVTRNGWHPSDVEIQPLRAIDGSGIPAGLPSYTCPWCGRTSYNLNDVRHRFCGACRQFEEP
jgi:hypothetical protein